jgi:hypothetical protein
MSRAILCYLFEVMMLSFQQLNSIVISTSFRERSLYKFRTPDLVMGIQGLKKIARKLN